MPLVACTGTTAPVSLDRMNRRHALCSCCWGEQPPAAVTNQLAPRTASYLGGVQYRQIGQREAAGHRLPHQDGILLRHLAGLEGGAGCSAQTSRNSDVASERPALGRGQPARHHGRAALGCTAHPQISYKLTRRAQLMPKATACTPLGAPHSQLRRHLQRHPVPPPWAPTCLSSSTHSFAIWLRISMMRCREVSSAGRGICVPQARQGEGTSQTARHDTDSNQQFSRANLHCT